jgi:aminopeptidase N
MQATFEVRVAVPSKTQVLFNMPASGRGPYSGGPAEWGAMEVVAFQETPPMPAYTLGLAVGPLGSQSAITKRCAGHMACAVTAQCAHFNARRGAAQS